MKLILSNIPPVKMQNKDIRSYFEDLMNKADELMVAVGYISEDGVAELKGIFENNRKSKLELIIGMHGFDGFTYSQLNAAKYLDDYLRSNSLGDVKVVKSFRYHGKVYFFLRDDQPIGAIIGSSNLSSVLCDQTLYETDLFIEENEFLKEIHSFICALSKTACEPLLGSQQKIIEAQNSRLDGYEDVEKVKIPELLKSTSFVIPINGKARSSNLNAFFGKGRRNKKGFVKPRPWYEIELIVHKKITGSADYPKPKPPEKSKSITVITDDGWKFQCSIGGANNKNFRSKKDLKILGRWLKGRLEDKGVLSSGELVTDDVLCRYGRSDVELTATTENDIWFLDFGTKSDIPS